MRRKPSFYWIAFVNLFLVIALTPNSGAQQLPEEVVRYAAMVFSNGYVLTVDTDEGDFSIAEAVAIRDGKILAVGSNDRILRMAGPKTQKINLNKGAVMPGVIDTHLHANRYAVSHYLDELPPEYQKLIRASGTVHEWKNKDQVLNQIKQIVAKEDPNKEWVMITVGRGHGPGISVPSEVAKSITRFDLDKVCPDRSLVIGQPATWGIVNSRGLERLLRTYGDSLPGAAKDSKGVLTGHVRSDPMEILDLEQLPQLPYKVLAPILKKELEEHWAPLGHTTFASRLAPYEIRAFRHLEMTGELPTRVAYGMEVGRSNPFFERDMRRAVEVIPGHGSDMVWMSGITLRALDGSLPEGDICSSFPKVKVLEDDVFPEGWCRWDEPDQPDAQTVRILARLGYRVSTMHTYGDGALARAVNLFEEVGAADRRFALDHTALLNRNVISKSGQLGMYWSVAAGKFSKDPERMATVYGTEVVNTFAFPLRTLLEAGAKLSYESSARGGDSSRTPFFDMEMFVTRKDPKGKVWGPYHALDRKTVIRMMTRWGAEYLLREKVLGTIEPGKFADLIVIDKNPLEPAISDDQLSEIKILMTLVGGRVTYQAQGFTGL